MPIDVLEILFGPGVNVDISTNEIKGINSIFMGSPLEK
jgi:hypothetical protein